MIMRARKKLLLVLLTAFAALMILVSHRLLPWVRKGTDDSHANNRMDHKALLANLLQNRSNKESSSAAGTIIAQKESLTMFVDQRGSPKRVVVLHGAREKATNDDRISEKNTNVKRSQLLSHQQQQNSLNGKTRSELSASQQQTIVKMDDSGVAAEHKGVSAGHKSGVEISYEGPALKNTGNFGPDEFANGRADRMTISNQDENLQKNPVANLSIPQAVVGRMERTDNPKAVFQQNAKGIVTSSPRNALLTASFDLTSEKHGVLNFENFEPVVDDQGDGGIGNLEAFLGQVDPNAVTALEPDDEQGNLNPGSNNKPYLVDITHEGIPADIAVDALGQQGTGNATNMSFIPRQQNTTSLKRVKPSTQEVHHLFFLKVHKAASTTVLNIVYRFSLNRRLVVLLPTPTMANILSEHTKNWVPSAALLPPGADHFDVLCNHVVFETSIRRMLPEDTVFVGIVRRSFDQFVSAFWYYRELYRLPYLTRIPGKRPVSTYLQDPARWEPDPRKMKFTNNRMSVDFGMDPTKVHDEVYVKDYLRYLDSTFHLVMVSDSFDESILLMRRLLGWKVEDVIYMKNNARKGNLYNQTFTTKEKQTHRDFNYADYALYEHFSKVLDDKVRAAGEAFSKEVESFQQICRSVRDYCQSNATEPLRVQAMLWKEEFSVTKETCALLTMDERKFVKIVRKNNGIKFSVR
ncbi:uncharacterized protein [Littorina saxatilis]|uniref:Galactosylceramide sulfotransferase n=1 Tax=Littorina saxatilis TaxID=31220 RepID=A0AAN9ASN9_9CAEN